MFVPLLGGAVSAGISYWVAESLMTAAEQYYTHDYVEFNDPEIKLADITDNMLDGMQSRHHPNTTAPFSVVAVVFGGMT